MILRTIALAAAVAALAFAATPASAACADDIKKARADIQKLPQSWRKDDALLKLQVAEAALTRKDEEACKTAVQAAYATVGG
jgi:hypothetical protein